ncbi:MAG: site-2 protease family protein [Limisphaerales bacterium]
MKWSFKLGRFLGIDVYVHFTFVLLLGFLGLAHWLASRDLGRAIEGVLFFLSLFLCVLLHEYGHALMARRYGIATVDITLLPIGGLARLERLPAEPIKEFWIAVAGPAVNVIIALALAIGLTLGQQWQPLGTLSATDGHFAGRLLFVNVFLVLFNLIPAFPMDGGRVLRSLLAMKLGLPRATAIAATLGQGIAFLFGFLGLFWNPMLIVIAFFVWIGASQEAGAVQMRSALSGITVERAMITDFKALTPTDSLARAVDLVLSGSQPDFPVVEGRRVVGVLTRTDLLGALAKGSPTAPVSSAMQRSFLAVDPREPVEEALQRGRAAVLPLMPVVENGLLIGLLTMENVSEFLLIQAAIHERRTTY